MFSVSHLVQYGAFSGEGLNEILKNDHQESYCILVVYARPLMQHVTVKGFNTRNSCSEKLDHAHYTSR